MKLVTTPKTADTKRSKIYNKYEKLLAEIEKQKQFKLNLQEGLKKAYLKIEQELSPMQYQLQLLLRDFFIRLDALATEIGVGKFNKEYLDTYMADELDVLLDTFGHQDTIISGLYQKYANVSLDELAADEDAVAMAKLISDLIGVELDVKELLEKGQDAYFAEFKEKFAEQINNKRPDFIEADGDDGQAKKPLNKKVTDETAQIAKDARSIYMRLIKKFHPDLEKDQAVKDEKTEIVKQVTKAYQENDFLSLLKLQLTYLDDNETDATAGADDMLKRYIKLLQKQLDELNGSIHDSHFTNGNAIADFIDKNGKFSAQKFSARRRHLEKEINHVKESIADSKKRPKGWFKEQISIIKDMTMQNMMQDIFSDMFENFK